jgi:type VI secretion system protein ImpL
VAKTKKTDAKGKKGEKPISSKAAVQRSFAKATKELTKMLRGREALYRIPWFALIGEPGSDKEDLLPGSGLSARPNSPDAFGLEGSTANQWWFYNNAVVIDFGAAHFSGAGEKLDDDGGGFFSRFRKKRGAQNGWKVNLDALRKQRLRRPLDGMILAVNARDLLKRTPDAQTQISRRAEAIADRIHEAQHRLGVHFPVYVVLTGCENLPGFTNFADALPDAMRDQMFGWSSPYEPDQTYQTEWVDEAMGSIHESISVTQLDLLPTIADQEQRDLLYLLPKDLQVLKESLKHYLDPIFKATSYRRALPLRGIYLTANMAPQPVEAEPEPGAPPPVPGMEQITPPKPVEKAPAKPVFVKQLLSEKIFQEPGLAVLDEEHNQAVAKTVRRARMAVIVMVVISALLGWYQHAVTSDRVDNFQSLLRLMETYQSPTAARKAMAEPGGGVKALETLSKLEVEQFEIFTAPSSYFLDQLTIDAKQAIAKLLGRGVAGPLRNALLEKTDLLLPPGLDTLTENAPSNIAAPSNVPRDLKALLHDLGEMRNFAEDIGEHKAYFDLYNRHQPDDLAKVYKFVTPERKDLEDTTESHSKLFREALLNTYTWPEAAFEGYANRARNKFTRMASTFHMVQFRKHPLRGALDELVELLDTVDARQPFETHYERLVKIRAAISLVEIQISGERTIWLLPDEFSKAMGASKYDDLMAQLNGETFPRAADKTADGEAQGIGQWFASQNQSLFQELKSDIFGRSTRLGTRFSILARKDIRVVLSPEMRRLKSTIDDLIAQPYVLSADRVVTFQTGLQRDAGARAYWNSNMIKQILGWHLQYTSFINAKRSDIPASIAIALKTAAHKQFRTSASQVLAEAKPERLDSIAEDKNTSWTSQARETLKEQIRNIAQEQPNIERVMVALNEVNQALNEPEDSSLFNALRDDSLSLLEQVDSVLETEKLYSIRGDRFSWWDSDQPPCVVAFGARDPNDLLSRLGVQQKAVATLSKDFARPLVEYMLRMGEPFVSDPDVDKWRKIGEVLEEYEKKVPGNGLEELERFVEEDLCKLRLSACSEQLEKHKDRFNRDNYFKDRKYRIALDMERRCDDILRQVTVEGYVDLQQFFAEKMQGRFPFAGPDVPAEVETGDIVEFFNRFERYSGAFTALITDDGAGSNSLFGKSTPEVRRFIKQVKTVRPLFASLLTAEDENPDLVLDIDIAFRVNKENEINGNQIIQWWTQIAEQRIDHRGNKRATQWRTSDSVGICFRWARDAMFIPAPNQRSEQARVNGRQACYVFGGRFSLLRLLAMHAATPADRGRRSFLRPHTLRFETETSLASAQRSASSLLVTDTRVYVRIGVVLPGAKSSFKMPEFPRRAPELTTEFLRANGIVAKGKGR